MQLHFETKNLVWCGAVHTDNQMVKDDIKSIVKRGKNKEQR